MFENEFPINVTEMKETSLQDGSVYTSATFKLANPIRRGKETRGVIEVNNPLTISILNRIETAVQYDRGMGFVKAREMSKLNKQEILKSMGFKKISELGKAFFDFASATTMQYVRIGEIFLDDNYHISLPGIPTTLSMGHLIELLTVFSKYETAENAVEALQEFFKPNGLLNANMSTSKMRQVLKEEFNPKIVDSEGKDISSEKTEEASKEYESAVDERLATIAKVHKTVSESLIEMVKVLNDEETEIFLDIKKRFEEELAKLF